MWWVLKYCCSPGIYPPLEVGQFSCGRKQTVRHTFESWPRQTEGCVGCCRGCMSSQSAFQRWSVMPSWRRRPAQSLAGKGRVECRYLFLKAQVLKCRFLSSPQIYWISFKGWGLKIVFTSFPGDRHTEDNQQPPRVVDWGGGGGGGGDVDWCEQGRQHVQPVTKLTPPLTKVLNAFSGADFFPQEDKKLTYFHLHESVFILGGKKKKTRHSPK